MSKTGRPQVLDDVKKKTILALLHVGCSRTTAAHYVNCDPKTIYNTAQRDAAFAEEVARAENTAEFTFLSRIFKACDDPRYWRSAAWALERMHPDRFGVRSPEAVTPQQLIGFGNRLMQILVEEVPVAEFRKKMIERIDQMLRAEGVRNEYGLPSDPIPPGKNSRRKNTANRGRNERPALPVPGNTPKNSRNSK